MHKHLRSVSLALVATVMVAAAAGAQATDVRRPPSLIRVHVTDSAGAPVPDAEVALMRGLKQVLASARTNATGDHEFLVELDSTDYSVVARKIGYTRGDRFIAVERAAVNAHVVMKVIPANALPTVTVLVEDLKRKSYHIDADDIAATDVPVRDALEIVYRLRPEMLVSRSGSWSGRVSVCPPLSNVWVNGRRYPGGFVIVDPMVTARMRSAGRGIQRVGMGNLTILSEIAPEHVSEMNYRDCFENTMKRVGANNALFIVLKPGVDYRPGSGSYVIGDTARVVVAR